MLCRSSLLKQHADFEAPRCALTAVHFPDGRTLAADESPPEPLPPHLQALADAVDAVLTKDVSQASCNKPNSASALGSGSKSAASLGRTAKCSSEGGSGGVQALAAAGSEAEAKQRHVQYCAAGYDPAWLLLFAVKVRIFCRLLFCIMKADACRHIHAFCSMALNATMHAMFSHHALQVHSKCMWAACSQSGLKLSTLQQMHTGRMQVSSHSMIYFRPNRTGCISLFQSSQMHTLCQLVRS